MRYLMVSITVIVFVCMPAVAGASIRVVSKPPVRVGWLEIKGYGKDRQSANRDALRQIQQVFGMHRIVSVSIVRDGVLKRDEVHQNTDFSVSRLDRYYDGTYRSGGGFVASFSFPKGDLVDLMADDRVEKEAPKMPKKKPCLAKKKASWKVPEPVIRFIYFFVWDIR